MHADAGLPDDLGWSRSCMRSGRREDREEIGNVRGRETRPRGMGHRMCTYEVQVRYQTSTDRLEASHRTVVTGDEAVKQTD